MLYILERLLSGDWIREGQDRTKVTSESIAIVNERRDRGLTLGDDSENEEKWTLEIYWR